MKQIDQVFCDQCGVLDEGRRAVEESEMLPGHYAQTLTWARRHAQSKSHDVHVLISDSLHYRHSSGASS